MCLMEWWYDAAPRVWDYDTEMHFPTCSMDVPESTSTAWWEVLLRIVSQLPSGATPLSITVWMLMVCESVY